MRSLLLARARHYRVLRKPWLSRHLRQMLSSIVPRCLPRGCVARPGVAVVRPGVASVPSVARRTTRRVVRRSDMMLSTTSRFLGSPR